MKNEMGKGILLRLMCLALVLVLGLMCGICSLAYAEMILDEDSDTWSEDCTITGDVTIFNDEEPVNVTADITLTIPAGKTLTVENGINAGGKTLTVQGRGTLIVSGENGTEGYTPHTDEGGTKGEDGSYGIKGNVIVKGTTVVVTGGKGGYGGHGRDGGLTTWGGNGGDGGYGIDGNITVMDGVVTVTGGKGGDGGDGGNSTKFPYDGGGDGGDAGSGGTAIKGNVTVEGGKITVTGGEAGRGGYGGLTSDATHFGGSSGSGGNGGIGTEGTVTVKAGNATVTGGGRGEAGRPGRGRAQITQGVSGRPGKAINGTITSGKTAEQSDDNSTWVSIPGRTSDKRYVRLEGYDPISYMDWDGSALVEKTGDESRKDCELVTTDTIVLEDGKWYKVVAGTLNISGRMKVQGTAHLILMDGANLKAQRGITVNSGSHLILHGQRNMTGTLTAQSSTGHAAIGSDSGEDGGAVTINGCIVTANGGNAAAGIGGGYSGNGGTVTVNGGTVQAKGGTDAAGIGGGNNGNGGELTVNGGEVWATGRFSGTGVGGGYRGEGGTVTVNGGTLWATGGSSSDGFTKAKGIGAGYSSSGSLNDGRLKVAASHAAYSSDDSIDGDNMEDAEQQQGMGSRLMTISLKRYMLVQQGTAMHVHDFTYSAEGATITATCTNTNTDCPLDNRAVSVTLKKPTMTVYGQNGGDISASATLTDRDAFYSATAKWIYEEDIRYVGRTPTFYKEQTTAPADAGSYTAKFTLDDVTTAKGSGKSVTVQVNYDIEKADPKADPPACTATYGQTLADVTLTNSPGNTPGTWFWVAPETSVDSVGEQTFKANFMPTDTANYNSVSNVDVNVVVGRAPNPATVNGVTTVSINRQNVDLSRNVILNGAEGAVTYTFSGEKHGCELNGSMLTSGSENANVYVKVNVEADSKYEALEKMIQVAVNAKPAHTITAADVITIYGQATNVTVAVDDTTANISYAVKDDGSSDYIKEVDAEGNLTLLKAGTATVVVTASETTDHAQTEKEVTVTIQKAANPATVTELMTVPINGHTVDLSETVDLNGAEGSVTYTISGEEHGCKLVGSLLTSGSENTYVFVKVNIASDSKYEALEKMIQVMVNPKPAQSIDAKDVTATYGEKDKRVNATSSGGGTLSYEVKPGSEDLISVDSDGRLTIKKAGTATVVVTAPETDSHTEGMAEVIVTILKAPNPAAVSGGASVMRGGSMVDLSNNVARNGAKGNVDYEISGDNKGCFLSTDGKLTSGNEAGTVTVNVIVEDDENYLASETKTITVTISDKQAQTITAADITAAYGDTDAIVRASVEPRTGGAISFFVKDGSQEVIDVNSVTGALTIKKPGTAYVVVWAAETETYAAAAKSVTVTINKAQPTVNVPGPLRAAYGQTLADLTLPVSSAPYVPGVWTWLDSRQNVGEVGQKTFMAAFTPADPTNYQTIYNDIPVVVDKAANPASIEKEATVKVGGNTVDLRKDIELNGASGTIRFEISGDAKDCTLDGGVLTSGKTTGTVSVHVSIAEDDHYGAVDGIITVTITAKNVQTISAEDVTATYGDTNRQVTAVSSGGGAIHYAVKEGSGDSIAVDPDSGMLTIHKVPANGKAYVTVTAAETENYERETEDVTVTIAKANAAVRAPAARILTYNGEAQELVDAGSTNDGELLYAVTTENKVPTNESLYSPSIPARTDAGTYYVWYKVRGDENHNDTASIGIVVTIAEPGMFTVTFDSDGGSEVQEQKVEKGKTAVRPTEPVKSGYTFIAWLHNDVPYNFNNPVLSDLQLTALWIAESAETFTVTFDSDGESEVLAQVVEKGKTAVRPPDPVKTGYTFIAWLHNDVPYNFSKPVLSDLNLTARWTADSDEPFTVTFDSDGGSAIPEQKVMKGKTVSRPADPVKTGYTFIAWLHNDGPYNFTNPVLTNLQLTALWIAESAETFTITFDSGGGPAVPEQKVEKGKTVVRPADPVRHGYTFIAWLHNSVPYNFKNPVLSDLKLTAQWIAESTETFTVRFNTEEGSEVLEQIVEKGKTVVRPPDPVRPGYVFVTWLHNLVPYEFGNPVYTDVILTAQWKPEGRYIYLAGDGSVWTQYSGIPLEFRIENTDAAEDSKTIDKFLDIWVDGNRVDRSPSNYEVKPGSVILKLQPNYLESLSVGAHRITAEFKDGMAEAGFTVAESAVTPESLPETGDTERPLLYGLVALAAICLFRMMIRMK